MTNDSWKEDLNLREKLKGYVTVGLRREEILDFMQRDFDCYAWSIRTLDRRLQYFDIRYTDTDVAVDEVQEAITREIEGPGRLLWYRAMQKKHCCLDELDSWSFAIGLLSGVIDDYINRTWITLKSGMCFIE